MTYKLNSIQHERSIRLAVLKDHGKGVSSHFLGILYETFSGNDLYKILEAYKFATTIEYDHVGLSSDVYLAHPLRVSEMVIGLSNKLEVDVVIIALLHNVLEVGKVDVELLKEKFGRNVSSSIQTLTVDREKQWNKEYKREYYKRINAGYEGMQIVKVIDKLDNMFMLGLNPDENVRTQYLDEINIYVIPIAKRVLPHIVEYLIALSENARQVGYFPNE